MTIVFRVLITCEVLINDTCFCAINIALDKTVTAYCYQFKICSIIEANSIFKVQEIDKINSMLLFKVSAVIDMAEKKIRELQMLPEFINISWTSYDDK